MPSVLFQHGARGLARIQAGLSMERPEWQRTGRGGRIARLPQTESSTSPWDRSSFYFTKEESLVVGNTVLVGTPVLNKVRACLDVAKSQAYIRYSPLAEVRSKKKTKYIPIPYSSIPLLWRHWHKLHWREKAAYSEPVINMINQKRSYSVIPKKVENRIGIRNFTNSPHLHHEYTNSHKSSVVGP